MWLMLDLTRRRDPHRPDCWRIHFGDVHVGSIKINRCVGNPGAAAWTAEKYRPFARDERMPADWRPLTAGIR
jgi:hypothetical protein